MLKYISYEILKPLSVPKFAKSSCFSLRSSANSAVKIEMYPKPLLVLQSPAALMRRNPDDTKSEIILQSSQKKSSSVNPDWRIILLRVLG